MKQLLFLIIVGIISTHSYSQDAVISGKIANFTGDSIGITVWDDYFHVEKTFQSNVDGEKGEFLFSIPLEKPSAAMLHTGKENISLYLKPQDTIKCYFDYNSIVESLKFEGNRASHYNYFVAYQRKFNLPHAMFTRPDWKDIFEMPPKEFKDYRKTKVKDDIEYLYDYCNTNPVTDDFRYYCETEIKYSYYYALISYSSLRSYFKKIDEKLPPDFYDDIREDIFNIDDNLNSPNYVYALKAYIYNLKSGTYDYPDKYFPKAMEIASKELSSTSLHVCQSYLIKDLLTGDASSHVKDSLTNSFLANCPLNELNQCIALEYTNSIQGRARKLPEEVLNTKITNTEGDVLTIGKIIGNNRGKVIYMDIWASFCGPCKVEMPYSNQLKEKFSNAPVSFIYLSIDNNETAWKKAINSWGVHGENYRINEGLNSTFTEHFNVKGIPRYMLLDKEGNVVFPYAASPSSHGIEHSINALVKK